MRERGIGVSEIAMPSVILVADDLTGAADSGVAFAKYGARVVVSWAKDADVSGIGAPSAGVPDADVVVISTESRHCTESEAVRRVIESFADVHLAERDRGSVWIYKKVDSTLRGHPGAELAAVMVALGDGELATSTAMRSGDALRTEDPAFSCALMAPALPVQGRVTRDGIHYVHDVPLSETVFGAEVGTSDVLDLISPAFADGAVKRLSLPIQRQGIDVSIALLTGLRRSSTRVVVADAQTDADLGALIDLAMDSDARLLCGSAGLAEALAERLAEMHAWPPRTERQQPAERQQPEGRRPVEQVTRSAAGVLVVAGSRNPQTLLQIEALAADAVPIVRPTKAWFEDATISADAVAEDLVTALDSGAAVLTTAGLPLLPVPGLQLVTRLAEVVRVLLTTREIAGLVLTGGDAAIAVGRALGATALRLHGEVERGVPWGTLMGGSWEDLPIVTKAGGFGDDETLVSAVRFFSATDQGRGT